MLELDQQYPEYDFKKHKGYPTKEHYERLTEYGISPVHRRSFLKKFTGGQFECLRAVRRGPCGPMAAGVRMYCPGAGLALRTRGDRPHHTGWGGSCLCGGQDPAARTIWCVRLRPVGPAKRRKLIETALYYTMEHPEYSGYQPRFDVMEIVAQPADGSWSILEQAYWKGAFDVNWISLICTVIPLLSAVPKIWSCAAMIAYQPGASAGWEPVGPGICHLCPG